MPWTDNLNFNIAWNRVLKDMDDDPYPDLLHYKEIQSKWDDFRDNLISDVEITNGYRPQPFRHIEVPKPNFTLRPAGAINIRDRIIYQAIADLLAPHFEPELSVYSYRLASPASSWMFLPGVEQWKLFESEAERLCHEYAYVLETDLASYFEHIDHKRLARRIDDIFPNIDRATLRPAKQLLTSLLGRWSITQSLSIPQVNFPSSFLGNIYLDEFDKVMHRNGYTYLRYVDDLRIFTNSIWDARRALGEIVQILRGQGLFLSSGKTRIVRSEIVLVENDIYRETINSIDDAFKSKRRSQIENILPTLQEFFFSIINDGNKFRDRHFRFCIYRYRKLKAFGIGGDIHRPIVETVLRKLYDLPSATDVFALYLSLFPGHTDISAGILDFLESDFNIYPWQEMHLLEVLIRVLNGNETNIAERAKRYVRIVCHTRGFHPSIRAKAYILLGKLGDWADRRNIRDNYVNEENIDIRKAILIATQELNEEERRFFYRNAQNDSTEIAHVVDYLSSLNQPKYHYFQPPDPEDFNADEDILRLDEDVDYNDIWY